MRRAMMVLVAAGLVGCSDGGPSTPTEPEPAYLNFSGTFYAHEVDGRGLNDAPLQQVGCGADSVTVWLLTFRLEMQGDGLPQTADPLDGAVVTTYQCDGFRIDSKRNVRGSYIAREDSIFFTDAPVESAAWGSGRGSFTTTATIRGRDHSVTFRPGAP